MSEETEKKEELSGDVDYNYVNKQIEFINNWPPSIIVWGLLTFVAILMGSIIFTFLFLFISYFLIWKRKKRLNYRDIVSLLRYMIVDRIILTYKK